MKTKKTTKFDDASRQLQEAMLNAQQLAQQNATNTISTELLLLAFAQTRDAGAALILADHSATFFILRKEFKQAKQVDHHLTRTRSMRSSLRIVSIIPILSRWLIQMSGLSMNPVKNS